MIRIKPSGIHNVDDEEKRHFRIGNLVIDSRGGIKADENGNPNLLLDYPVVDSLSFYDADSSELVKQKILDVCDLKKGVSDVVLYYGTMIITQELFQLKGRYPFFVLLLLGRHGSFKSMLSRRIISLLKNSRIQEVKFYNLNKYAVLEKVLNDTEIFTVLIDDIIPVNGYSQKKRYSDIFDWVSRSGDREQFKGGTIITAERIPEEVVSSAYDRIWEIQMPILNDEEKKRWYTVLSHITNQDLVFFYVDYCRKLMMNYDRVLDDITCFWDSFELPKSINRKTRIADHFEYIVLSEYLLKKYYLEQSEVTVDSICINGSYIIKRAESQQNRIIKMDMSNREIDIPYNVYQVLMRQDSRIKLISNRRDYYRDDCCYNKALLEKAYIFVKPDILHDALNNYTDSVISLKKLSTVLEREGILISGGGNSKTVTEIKSGRHYKLNIQKMISYRNEYVNLHGEEDDNLIL